jgi:membrane protease YdiL (CAAX protease family)
MLAAQFLKVNSALGLAGSTATGLKRNLPFLLLPSRLVLFALFQLVFALVLWPGKGLFDFPAAGALWPYAALGANIVTVLILRGAFKVEGLAFTDMYRFSRGTVGRDILIAVAFFVVAAPLSYFPNGILGSLLYADPRILGGIMFPPLPRTVAILTVLFPLTIAFAELPLYMGYIMPRLSARLRSPVLALVVVGFFLALQHCALPLMFDGRFILWRFGMFLPLALMMALALTWRPWLLPYLMIGHALIDLSTVVILVMGSTP